MSHLDNGFRPLTLQRFPATGDVNPLQAREAAGECLLQQLDGTGIHGPVLILNNAFDVLSCALTEHKPYSIDDSYVSELTARENLRFNKIDELNMEFLDSTADCPQQPGVVLIKVPKALALLEQQLHILRKVVTSDIRTIAGARVCDIHTSTLELFEKVLSPTTTTLAREKAYLINCTFNEPQLTGAPRTVSWKLEGTDWTIHSHASVFSRTGFDIGMCFFMQHLPENLEGEIVDLGCGNGVIGLTLFDKNPQTKVMFVGESPMAVASNHLSVETNMPKALGRYEFMINNTLSGVEPFHFNAVLCSPPFHQQHALTDNVAWETFRCAHRYLKINGRLYIVANHHLDCFHELRKVFGGCTTVATNNRFMVLKAVKLGRRR